MGNEVFNRQEKKFFLTEGEAREILKRTEGRIRQDSHCGEAGTYSILNLYYDTEADELINRSIEKPIYKEKLRLRSYGVPSAEDKVFLEIKKKYKKSGNKRRITLPLSQAYQFIENKGEMELPGVNRQIAAELSYMLKRQELFPKVFLSYERMAFFCPQDEEFRLTFDRNILTRRHDLKLENGNSGERLIPEGHWIMEVKVPDAIPLWFVQILSDCGLYSTSFSKYGTEYRKWVSGRERRDGKCLKPYLKAPAMQGLPYPLPLLA